MKKLILLTLVVAFGVAIWGCSSGPSDDSAPKGDPPVIKQAEPGALSPEERGRQAGGGEGTR